MKSRASFKSHPLHPILVTFPIAFFTGSFICAIVSLIADNQDVLTVERYLLPAGIIGAVLAAIPGLIDYISVIPPESSAKKRGAKHGILNSLALTVFICAFLLREDISRISLTITEAVGMGLMLSAGWMGGTLVYRNQIAVDHRYAGAGKWKEEYLKDESIIDAGDVSELKLNQMKLLHVGKKRIVVARTERGLAAFDDHCTHRGGGLSDGSIACGTVQCPWHGSQFDVFSGEVKAGPAEEKIRTYTTNEKDGRIWVQLK